MSSQRKIPQTLTTLLLNVFRSSSVLEILICSYFYPDKFSHGVSLSLVGSLGASLTDMVWSGTQKETSSHSTDQ